MSSRRTGKKGQGVEEGLTFLGAMIAIAAIALLVFSFASWDKNKKAYEDRVITDVMDAERFFNSFMSIQLDGGTMYDLLMESYLQDDYAKFGSEADAAIKKYHSQEACLEFYIDGMRVHSTNMISSCKPGLLAEMKMPAYGKDISVRMIVG